MRLKGLSHYNGDINTRFGDCILLYDNTTLIVYDCGHPQHAEEVKKFLQSMLSISQIHIVISHNDSDHTNGVCDLLAWLYEVNKYKVTIYSHQYLKHVDTILNKIDDGRRNRESLKKSLIAEFDNINKIIETAQDYSFTLVEALCGTSVSDNCIIVGPTVDQFTEVAAKAVDSRASKNIGEGHEEETVMNAASVQLKCKLENEETLLLCGDASPSYLQDLNNYDIIQLPHHGQLEDALAIFDSLKDSYSKTYFISDNTGSSATSGGSDKLIQFMKDELYPTPKNTKNGVVVIPQGSIEGGFWGIPSSKPQGVRLGDLDIKL